jgi:hypothetical protein
MSTQFCLHATLSAPSTFPCRCVLPGVEESRCVTAPAQRRKAESTKPVQRKLLRANDPRASLEDEATLVVWEPSVSPRQKLPRCQRRRLAASMQNLRVSRSRRRRLHSSKPAEGMPQALSKTSAASTVAAAAFPVSGRLQFKLLDIVF